MRDHPIPSQPAMPPPRGEVDVWWGGYAGRTMLPSFVGCVLITATLGFVAWRLTAVGWPAAWVRYTFYLICGLLWLFQVALWVYRCVATSYRLTSQRLYVDRGFLRSSFGAFDLDAIQALAVEQDRIEQWLGVARVRLTLANPPGKTVLLPGVSDPKRLVKEWHRARKRRDPGITRHAPV